MNHIFKVIWNQATQSWMVVSELTKAHKKQSSSNSEASSSVGLAKISALVLALLFGSNTANAAWTTHGAGSGLSAGQGSVATQASAVAAGAGAQALAAATVAIGTTAQATGYNAVAIGNNAQATDGNAIAMGQGATATGLDSVAIMRTAKAPGTRAVAFGINAEATGTDSLAMLRDAKAVGNYSIAVGHLAETKNADSVAIGRGAKTASGERGISIGTEAGINNSTTAANSNITIGAYSRVGWDGNQNVGNSPGRSDNVNGRATQSIAIGSGNRADQGAWAEGDQSISIGANTHARGDSSIAIGGDDVDKVAEKGGVSYTDKDGTQKTGTLNAAMQALTGTSLQAYNYKDTTADGAAVAIGMKTRAADLSLALGSLADAQKVNTVAIGSGAKATLDNAVAIGGGSLASSDNPGTKQTKTTIGGLEYTWAGGTDVVEGDIVSFGSKGYERQLKNVAAGKVSEDSTDGINGSQLYSVAEKIVTHNYLKYAGDDGQGTDAAGKRDGVNAIEKSLDTHLLDIVGGADKAKLSDKNIGVNNVGGKLKVQLAKELTGLTSAGFGDVTNPTTVVNADGIKINQPAGTTGKTSVSVTKDGLDNGNNTIKNVASALTPAPVATSPAGTTTPAANQPNLVNLGTAPNQTALGNDVLNSAATVGDLANMGWVVSSDKVTGSATGEYKDVVKNANEVKFVGKNAAKVSGKTENGIRTITVDVEVPDVKTAEMVSSTDGSVIAPATDPALQTALKAAKDALAADPTDAAKQQAVKDAETALNNAIDNTAVATAKNVADMINNSGFTLKTSDVDGGKKVSGDAELIKPGSTVEMVAGKNLTVKQEANGKVTYATADNVSFNTVNIGPSYTDKDGNPVTKNSDGTYSDANGQAVPEANVTEAKPVAMKAEKAKPADNNQSGKAPETALNFSTGTGADAKPTQLTGVGSVLNTDAVPTNTNGTPTAAADQPKLVNLGTAPNQTALGDDVLNSAATVRDLANMGWVVSTTAGNAYKDVVKNANQVDFVGKNGITVTGATVDGVRTITVEAAQSPVVYTDAKGNKLTKVGDNFYPADSVVVDGKAYPAGTTPAQIADGTATPIPDANAVKPADVITSLNSGDDKTANTPTTLANVKSNLPTVNDTDKTAKDKDGKDIAGKTNVAAPITAADAANLLKPTNDDGSVNPNYAGNNAATVSDVLNAGWNLKNNGEDRDFVKPYDTVNFVDGANTTAVVTTSADGTTSDVTYNVTGLPVSYTDKDGKPVSKVGDKYYTVNDKGVPVGANGKPAVGKNANGEYVDDTGAVIAPIDTATAPLSTNLVNPNVANSTTEPNKQTTTPTQLGNVANGATTFAAPQAAGNDVKLANDGKWYPADKVNAQGVPETGAAPVANPLTATNPTAGLIDFANSVATNAATVGDLQNMGWVVGAPDNEYVDQVRNANKVNFKGKGLATVTGETDKDGIRTITVDVDAQRTVEAAQNPVVYTDAEGNKLTKIGDKFYPEGTTLDKDGNPVDKDGAAVQPVDKNTVTASMNNGEDKASDPMRLSNVGSNLPTVKDGDDKKAYDPNSTTPLAGKDNKAAPITAADAANLLNPTLADGKANPNFRGNNAATVSDVLNAGWNLQGNGSAVDFVKPFDTVNFIDGKGTKAVVETSDNLTSTVKFDVDAGEITADADKAGAVKGPSSKTADEIKALAKDLKDAQDALAAATTDDAKKDAQDKVAAAEKAINDAGLNKVATAQNVADMINNAGFNLKTSATTGGEKATGTKDDGELINPGSTVEMVAGKNMTVKQDENGKITYATKDDVEFNTVKVGSPNSYVDNDGKPLVKVGDNYYKPEQLENGQPKTGETPVDPATVKNQVAPVAMKTEAATPADSNVDKDGASTQPTTALNISSGTGDDAKPTQLKGVGSVLNTTDVDTKGDQADANGNVTTPAKEAKDKLVNLGTNPKTGDAPLSEETLNSAATVRDLANMGWVVSAKDNDYTNTVKNANKVEFKGDKGISVTGQDVTQADGTVTREITVAIAEGKVTNDVTITKADGSTVNGVIGSDGKYYEKDANGKPDTSKEITVAQGDKVQNDGANVVTGNTVATAIQESGWNIGKEDASKVTAKFETEAKVYDKVNPNDDVRFVDGDGTTVSMVTVDAKDETGAKKATTYVKIDVATAGLSSLDNGQASVTDKAATDALNKANADLAAAQAAAQQSPNDTAAQQKLADAQTAQANAQKAVNDAVDALGNKVATAKDVINAINNAGFTLKTSEIDGGKKVSGTDELINPGKSVEMIAGKNMSVKQEADGKITYATADDVNFTSVTFGENGPKISGTPATAATKDASGNVVPAQPAQLNVNNAKITGVADGDITPTSKDAVNGSQIYALTGGVAPVINNDGSTSLTMEAKGKDADGKDITVEKTYKLTTYNVADRQEFVTNSVVSAVHNMNEQGIKFFHTNDGEVKPVNQDKNSIDSSASGAYATAIGYQATAAGTNAVAMGNGSQALATNSIAIGTGNIVRASKSGAFGDPNIINDKTVDNVAVSGSYAIGNDNIINTSNTFVLGNDVNNAGNSTAMGSTVENSVYLGNKTTATAGDGSRTGTLKNIKQDGTAGETTTAGSTGTVSTATVGSMTYGGFAGAKADGVVSVGAAGNERRVQNVAAGEISATSTDAINGSQLYAVAKGVGDLNNRINKLGKRADAGTASALAASHIPQAYTPGKSLVGVGAGHYQGQSGIAVGMSRISDNGKYIIRFSGTTNSQGKVGVAAGFGYQF